MKDEFFASEEFKDRGYDRETLDEVFDEIISQDDLSDEGAAHKFFEEMWQKINKKINPHWKQKVKFLDDETPKDKYEEFLSDPVKPKSYDISTEDLTLDQENYDNLHIYAHSRIGRYPHGFRHFENYANYSQVKKNATIQEYMEEMNRQCEFNEFVAIRRQHTIEESRDPTFLHEMRHELWKDEQER